MEKNLLKKNKKNFLYTGVGKIIMRLANAVLLFVLVKYLSKEEYGIYNLLLSIVPLIVIFASWGWPVIFIRFLPQYIEKKDGEMVHTLVLKGILTRMLIILCILICMWLFFDLIAPPIGLFPYKDYFLPFTFGIYFLSLIPLFKVILNASFLQKQTYTALVIGELLTDLIIIVYLIFGGTLPYILLIKTLYAIGMFLYLGKFILKDILKYRLSKKLKKIPANIKQYGLYGLFNEVGTYMLDPTIDYLIIAKFLGVEAVAVYAVAEKICTRIKIFIPTSLMKEILEPLFYKGYEQNKTDQYLNQNFQFLTILNFIILIPAFVFIVSFGYEILVLLFDDKYDDAYPVLLGLAFFHLVGRMPTGFVAKAKEKMSIMATSKLFSVYNLIMNLILVQKFGLMGIVFATGTALFFKEIFVYWRTRRYGDIRFPLKKSILLFLISIAIIGSIKLIHYFTGISMIWVLVLTVISILPFLVLVIKSSIFSSKEKLMLESITISLVGRKERIHKIFRYLN